MRLTECLFLIIAGVAVSLCAINDTCVIEPTTSTCKNYELPSSVVSSDIEDLCSEMGFMCGCTIDQMCKKSEYSGSSAMYCKPFSILKDLCVDMPKMKGCTNYRNMCGNQTIVEQCTTADLPLPKTMMAQNLIRSICSEMDMDGCSECISDMSHCDTLTVYSNLCLSMPDMSQCSQWKTMCKSIPDWSLCSSSSAGSPPQMRMYFHGGYADYVLFKSWVPRTSGQYFGTWLAVFLFGLIFEVIKAGRSYLEKKWKMELKEEGLPPHAFVLRVDALRALVRFVEVMWGLLVMLIAMTFNTGLFFSVCLGAMVGTFAFGRFINYEPAAVCCE